MAINKVLMAALKALSYPDIDIKKSYKIERQLKSLPKLKVPSPYYTSWDHQVFAGDHQVPVRIFTPRTVGRHRVLVFFHGGGWVTGNIDSYDRVCRDMCQLTNCIVVSVDYRLAPEYPFPAGLEDCYQVTREIFLDDSLFDTSPDEIVLVGDSAGGNLAAAVSLLARDRREFLPRRQILIYPATYPTHGAGSPFASTRENGQDYLLTSKRVDDYLQLYVGRPGDFQNPYFAPLLCGDLSRQPDTLIITAEYDPLRDEGEAYGQKLSQFGARVRTERIPDALHGFFSLPLGFAMVKDCYRIIGEFLSDTGAL